MRFLWDWMLPSLAVVPLLLLAYVWVQRRRARYTLRYSSLLVLKQAAGRGYRLRRHFPPFLFLLAITAMLIGLARPYAVVLLPRAEATVILAVDVSGSMRADDLKPSRIEAAKSAARAFVERQDRTTRIGLVAFSGNASLVQAPTVDRDLINAAINGLTLQRSTAIGWGILTSLDAILENPEVQSSGYITTTRATAAPTPPPVPEGTHVPAIVILLTDGQNITGPSPLEAADKAAAYGVRVYTIGVGTTAGTTLRFGGFGGFRTALDEPMLRRIAETTDGMYFHASDENALQTIYRNIDTQLIVRTEKTELTTGFTAAAMGLVLLALLLSSLWFGRLP